LALDVDLGDLLPAPANGLVGDPGVVRGDLGRLVIEREPDDLLGDVTVDQTTGERVTPLVRGQMNRLAVFVVDLQSASQELSMPR
jgi:hypothetical protein